MASTAMVLYTGPRTRRIPKKREPGKRSYNYKTGGRVAGAAYGGIYYQRGRKAGASKKRSAASGAVAGAAAHRIASGRNRSVAGVVGTAAVGHYGAKRVATGSFRGEYKRSPKPNTHAQIKEMSQAKRSFKSRAGSKRKVRM